MQGPRHTIKFGFRWPLVLLLAGLGACSAEVANEDVLVASCVETLSERLKAPSTLEVMKITKAPVVSEAVDGPWISHRIAELESEDEVLEPSELGDLRAALADVEAGKTVLRRQYETYIEYDADNAYGAPIRAIARCEAVTYDGEITQFSSVSVNGYTSMEWLAKSINP